MGKIKTTDETEGDEKLTVAKKEVGVAEDEDKEEDNEEKREPTALKINKDGTKDFDLSDKRRCTVREWKDEIFVDLREYYTKNGKKLPGNKGISLTVDQYKYLRNAILNGLIDEELKVIGAE